MMPPGWSGSDVFMLRMIGQLVDVLGHLRQVFADLDAGDLGGDRAERPAVVGAGFMSKVSIWLAPPFIHSRMQCLPSC